MSSLAEPDLDPALRSLFPLEVVTCEATPAMWDAPPHPGEQPAIRHAVTSRRREFAAGRACARRAVSRLGFGEAVLPASHDHLPRWPDGILGSIAHCRDRCVVAVARRGAIIGLGLDLERDEPLEGGVVQLVCSPEELAAARVSAGRSAAVLLFSIKEAVYKCCFPLTRERWDFSDVTVLIQPEGCFEAVTPAQPVSGRYAGSNGWVLAGAVLRDPQAEPRNPSSALR